MQYYQLLIILACILISIFAQSLISNTYRKYMQYPASCNMTGAQAAERFLNKNDIYDVQIICTAGTLTDSYDPTNRVIRLSKDIYYGTSVASVAIACHEVGHAIQHAQNYPILSFRNRIIPVVNIANSLSWILIFIGLIFGLLDILIVGVVCFGIIALFQLITLPVEFNASRRALAYLDEGVLAYEEHTGAKKVLNAAAFTYVAALLVSLLQIARFVMIIGGSRRN